MQGDDARCIADLSVAHSLQGIFERPDLDADIFRLFHQAMQPARPRAVATPQVQMDEFIAAARGWKILGHRPKRSEGKPSFLLRFTMSNFFRLFVLVDQAGHQFHQPRVGDLVHGADAKLLDQHHFIALRVVGQHAHRVMAHEQFTADFAAHATGKQFVTQVHTVEFVETLEAALALDDVHGARCGVGEIGHDNPRVQWINTRFQPRLRAILTRPYPLMQPLSTHRDGRQKVKEL